MSVFQALQSDRLAARKGGAAMKIQADLLTTLVGEVTSRAKNDGNREVTDDDVIKTVKKFADGAQEVINLCLQSQTVSQAMISRADVAKIELAVLNAYLPEQMDETTLAIEIDRIIAEGNLTGPKALGVIMSSLKNGRFAGQYDGKMAQTIAKSRLG